jgi:hypothetical protein
VAVPLGWWLLSPSDCSDVATTAAEGGIGYWSQIDSYAPSRWMTAGDELPDDFVYYSLRELGDHGEPVGEPVPLTVAGVRAGYVSACDSLGRDVLKISMVGGESDMDGLDADTADLIVQHAILGKMVYG